MKKNKIKWSKKYFQAKIGTWNCWSMSNERYHYCKGLQYDILDLTELHNTQEKVQFQHKTWIHSAPAAIDANDKCSDPASGVAIMFSPLKPWTQDTLEHGSHGFALRDSCATYSTSWSTYHIRAEP